MKKFFIPILFLFAAATPVLSQYQYEVLPDNESGKILKGIISAELLEKDSSFSKWYENSLRGYNPNANAITSLKKYSDSIQLVAFMGTWCEDSHFIIPKLYYLLDAAGFSRNKISLLGVDRSKKTLSHLTEALDVVNVPTIIVMKKGKEIGRVVEYGKSGLFDKDLGEIISSIGSTSH